jgi:glycosyltransferase involved in cell wall biosynthesis
MRGALPEVVAHERTGFLVDDLDAMLRATDHLHKINPPHCRAHVERHFSGSRMADDYERLYARVVERSIGEAA